MTEKELKALKEQIKNNELYQQSVSTFKDFQFEQFTANGEILEGQHSRIEKINGKEVLVIFNFKKGLIHSENDLPAIEYPMHWEYWNNGLIAKVVDNGAETEEIWENGVPIKINHNMSD